MITRLCLLLAAALCTLPAFSQITYVTVAGAGAKDGSSWSNALCDSQLRGAVMGSAATLPNTSIWVAAGAYYPHAVSRDSSFRIHPLIKVYGGFTGTETQLNQRNWTTNQTILSGDIGVAGDSTDNSYNVVKFELATAALLDGFTITGGYANHHANYQQQLGAGISNTCTAPSAGASVSYISNCRIIRNYALNAGGGISNVSFFGTAGTIISNCTFEQNSAGNSGGAIYSTATDSTGNTNLTISGSLFLSNFTTGSGTSGGAISVLNTGNSHNALITGCSFTGNHTDGIGGALSFGSNAAPGMATPGSYTIQIDSCNFLNNSSGKDGMAIYLMSRHLGNGSLSISNSLFDQNTSAGNYGVVDLGHLSSLRTINRITSCTFTRNQRGFAGNAIRSAAGFAPGGALTGSGTDSLIISNSFFYNNCNGTDIAASAANGAKHITTCANATMYHDAAGTTVATGMENTAIITGGSNVPGATDAALYVQNSILWHNLPAPLAGAQQEIKNRVQGAAVSASHSRVTSSILTGAGTSLWPPDYGINGGNNSGAYPAFVDTAGLDFRLRCGAFGVDGGSNALITPAGLARDVAGNARIYNSIVDIGAFETNPATLQPPVTPVTAINGMGLSYGYFANWADSVHWDFGTGATSVQRSGIYSYPRPGIYTVCLFVKNGCGSADTCFQVTIGNPSAINIVNGEAQIAFYPNPVTDQLHIPLVQDGEVLNIYSMTGARIYTRQLSASGEAAADLSGLAAGAYILELRSGQGAVRRARFLKQ